jgi:hypothetical protein
MSSDTSIGKTLDVDPAETGFSLRTKHLGPPKVADLPEPPSGWLKIIGPGIVGAGVGLASGESGPTSPVRSGWSSSGAPSSV